MDIKLEGTITVQTLVKYLERALKTGETYSACEALLELLRNLEVKNI